MAIDWELVGVPQGGGYDTAVILSALTPKYAQAPLGDGLCIWPEGRARWTSLGQMPSSSFKQLPFDAPSVLEGLRRLTSWPEVRVQCAQLLTAICPLTLGQQGGHGCSCGNYRDDFGWIYVTADDPWGFAEGVVHEMAHWKLRALGVWFEEWSDLLLLNDPSERYASPVRKDVLRPMGAVLHGQYSYVHVTEIVLRMLQATHQPTASDYDWLALQVKRISEGHETINAHARATREGTGFLRGVQAWTQDVIARSRAVLDQPQAGAIT